MAWEVTEKVELYIFDRIDIFDTRTHTSLTVIFQANLIGQLPPRLCRQAGVVAIRYYRLYRTHEYQLCKVFTDRMPFLLPNQQCQNTEGKTDILDSSLVF